MPKSKKNAKKAAQAKVDFKKPKAKIGKKIAPANQTKAPQPRRPASGGGRPAHPAGRSVAVTRRRVTVDELFGQLKHYNAAIRKEALLGLKELCGSHPQAVCLRLREVLEATLKAVTDAERVVRQAVVTLYRKLLATPPPVALSPFLKLLAMHCIQGLTHLRQEVRSDTLKLLQAVLEVVSPEAVRAAAPSLAGSLLEMLGAALRAGGLQAKGTDPELRASILRVSLLICPTPSTRLETASEPGRCLDWSDQQNPTDRLHSRLWRPRPPAQAQPTAGRLPSTQLASLAPLLASVFAECGTAEPQRPVHVETLQLILRLSAVLASSTEFSVQMPALIEQHVLPQLPFNTVRPSAARSELCCALCRAVATVAQAAGCPGHPMAARVVGFAEQQMEADPSHWEEPAQLTELVSGLDGLIGSLPGDGPARLQAGMLKLSGRLHPQSQARCVALSTLCRWGNDWKAMITLLPKGLWQLKASQPGTSAVLVDTLLRLAASQPEAAAKMAGSLPPLVHVTVPAKPGKPAKEVFGPLVGWPVPVQRRFLSIIHWLPELSQQLLAALARLTGHPDLSAAVAEFVIELVHSARRKVPAQVYVSFQVSVALAEGSSEPARRRAVDCLARLELGSRLGEGVVGLIAQVASRQGAGRARAGVGAAGERAGPAAGGGAAV